MWIRNGACPEEFILNGLRLNKHVQCDYTPYVTDGDDREEGEVSLTFLGPHPSRKEAKVFLFILSLSAPSSKVYK